MSSIGAVSASIPPYAHTPQVHPKNGRKDGDQDQGTDTTATAGGGTPAQASPGHPGSAGAVNLTA